MPVPGHATHPLLHPLASLHGPGVEPGSHSSVRCLSIVYPLYRLRGNFDFDFIRQVYICSLSLLLLLLPCVMVGLGYNYNDTEKCPNGAAEWLWISGIILSVSFGGCSDDNKW